MKRRNKNKTRSCKIVTALAATSAVAAAALGQVTNTPADPAATTIPTATTTPVTVPALTPANTADPDAWQFGVTVPLWAPQINGNSTTKGVQKNVDISFDQLKDHLDASFSLAVDAHKGKFGIYGDVGYMKFSANPAAANGDKADLGLKFLVADAGVSYLLVKTESEHPFLLEGTLGVRYWYVDLDLTVKDSLGNVLLEGSDTRDLLDPMVGLRGSQYFTKKLHLDFAGDIGGFGFSDNQAELDWSATGVVTYDFAKWFSLSAGYKALAVDASKGSGASKNGLDLVFHGALIAANFKF